MNSWISLNFSQKLPDFHPFSAKNRLIYHFYQNDLNFSQKSPDFHHFSAKNRSKSGKILQFQIFTAFFIKSLRISVNFQPKSHLFNSQHSSLIVLSMQRSYRQLHRRNVGERDESEAILDFTVNWTRIEDFRLDNFSVLTRELLEIDNWFYVYGKRFFPGKTGKEETQESIDKVCVLSFSIKCWHSPIFIDPFDSR